MSILRWNLLTKQFKENEKNLIDAIELVNVPWYGEFTNIRNSEMYFECETGAENFVKQINWKMPPLFCADCLFFIVISNFDKSIKLNDRYWYNVM